MPSPWSKALEALGRFGSRSGSPFHGATWGIPGQDRDVMQDVAYRSVRDARTLFDAWAPEPDSPWRAFAKPTFFAAFDSFLAEAKHRRDSVPNDGYGPLGWPGLDVAPSAQTVRIPPGTALVVDLPGSASAAYGAMLAWRHGFVPVPLWNNWPHEAGLVGMNYLAAALLFYLPWVQQRRMPSTTPMPAFFLDRNRLGSRPARPMDFDNRYFHVDVDFPSAAVLRRHGVERLAYVRPKPGQEGLAPISAATASTGIPGVPSATGTQGFAPLPTSRDAGAEMDDLNETFTLMGKAGLPLHLAEADLSTWDIDPAGQLAVGRRRTVFSGALDPAYRGFRRNSAGGFGALVPQPGSGG